MAQHKRKSKVKVKKAHAAKKKARVVRALKRPVAKARPAPKKLLKGKHAEKLKKPLPAAKVAPAPAGLKSGKAAVAGKPDPKAPKAPIKTSAKQALELLE